ncbi:septum formation protein [Natronobacillus azotifigens]|uniref:dTTP/UTP pyrophosphatase n=1 Tax=Natronobacillus azotifigens TaxID=472978 RepID=A0A9J6RF15_9BACI|nr:Maf family protein [Natronobacillus azotifigens]MCZ0704151.1 Maf family protein [Natronobacillus azotifigens]
MANKLILASSSPRRQALLKQVNLPHQVTVSSLDETLVTNKDPLEKVKQLATLKGRNVPIKHADEVILSADTVVSFQQNIFEKPKNSEEAKKMITSLSGEEHEVYTGVMIRSSEKEVVFVEQTKVKFWPLSEDEINWYIPTTDPYDKAGGYGIQSIGAIFVKQMVGDYYNVVGLPISRVVRELKAFSVFPVV